jgi:hypothetical protein
MKKKYILLATTFLMLVILGSTPAVFADTQWFPTEGTSIEFQISLNVELLNGSTYTSNKFDLYFYIDRYIAVSSINKHLFAEPGNSWTSILNNTELAMVHYYTENSSTQWNRTHSLSLGNGTVISFHKIHIYGLRAITGGWYSPIFGDNDSVEKSSFFVTMTSGSLMDYFNCSKGLGASIPPYSYIVTSVTSDTITATLGSGGDVFQTYVAGSDGKVSSHSVQYTGSTVTDAGAAVITMLFSIETAGIPSFSMVLTAFSFILGVALIKIGVRRKIAL